MPASQRPRFFVSAAVLSACAAAAQGAQPEALPEVAVSASRIERDSFEVPASVHSLGPRALREAGPQVDLSEALPRVPGVTARNRHNYAQDLQISSRGFGARASFGVRGIRLIADGIPATMPDGQGQAASFNLSSAQRVEVLRGPFSSLYGNAAGGVIQAFTADPPPAPVLTTRLHVGSRDTLQYGMQYGGRHGLLGALIDASRFSTGGYRDHSAARRDSLHARFSLESGAHGRLAVTASALDQPDTQDPLGLTAAQVAQNPRQAGANARAFNTRKSVAQQQVGLVHDLALGSGDRLQARAYLGNRQVTQFLAIPLAAQNAPTASGGVVDLDRGYGGAGLRFTRDTTLAAAPLTLHAGIDYDRMAERRRGFINDSGTAGGLKRDEDDRVANADLYLQAEWRPAQRWLLAAGVRHSRVRFAARDHFVAAGNPDDSGAVAYARTTPVAGASYSPHPALNVYANLGRGFETPTFAELAYRPGGASGLNFALRPADSLHRELGIKALLGAAGRLDAALFRVDVDDEIVVNSSSGGRSDFRNAAQTRREGFELLWTQRWGRGFETHLAWTLLDARFVQPFTSGTPPVLIPAGNRLPGVSPHNLFAELVWRDAPGGFHAGVEIVRSGRVHVNDANSEAAAPYTVWNLRAGFEQRGRHWRLSEFVRIDNAGDRRYIGSVIVAEGNGRYYEPAPGRSVMLGISAELVF